MNLNQSRLAVVLAAGKGTRMKSELPKVLSKANGRPLIEYVIDALQEAGVEEIIAVVGYRADLVRETLADQPNIQFAEQTRQLGTGHAVMVCRDLLEQHDGPVVVVTGDSPMLQVESVRQLLAEFENGNPACVLGTLIHDNPAGLGRIVRDEQGNFTGIVEEKDADDTQREIREVNMSTYVFDCRRLIESLAQLNNSNNQNEYYITDIPGIMLRSGDDVRALPVLNSIEALSVNTVDDLQLVEAALSAAQANN